LARNTGDCRWREDNLRILGAHRRFREMDLRPSLKPPPQVSRIRNLPSNPQISTPRQTFPRTPPEAGLHRCQMERNKRQSYIGQMNKNNHPDSHRLRARDAEHPQISHQDHEPVTAEVRVQTAPQISRQDHDDSPAEVRVQTNPHLFCQEVLRKITVGPFRKSQAHKQQQ